MFTSVRSKRILTAQAEIQMTPLIDMVFQLLIFFMCTSSFRQAEKEMPTQLPRVGGGQAWQEDFAPIRIRVTKTGAGVRVTCDGRYCPTFKDLLDRLRERRAIADVPVLIDGEETVPFGSMVAALDVCYRADLRRVAFSARGGGK